MCLPSSSSSSLSTSSASLSSSTSSFHSFKICDLKNEDHIVDGGSSVVIRWWRDFTDAGAGDGEDGRPADRPIGWAQRYPSVAAASALKCNFTRKPII